VADAARNSPAELRQSGRASEHPPSLFVFDVDGTLLDSQLRIRPSTSAGVRELLHAGHRVALASARPPVSGMAISEQLLGSVTEIISLNGAFVTHGQEILLEQTMPSAAVRGLIGMGRELGLEINLLAGWDWLVDTRGPGVEEEVAIVGFEPQVVASVEGETGRSVHKILFIGEHEKVMRLRDDIAADLPGVTASLSKTTYCEVVAASTSKAGAMEFLAAKFDIPRQRVIAFGDGENDLPMIEAAGVGVAMGNGMDAVKSVAQLVTQTHDEDGIAHALLRLGYIGQ
jgi:Cof subfamily protein (haloacid dehalogenase superfamily)